MLEHPEGGGHEQYPDEDGAGGHVMYGEQGMSPSHHQHNNPEWLDMREASLKLTATDLNDQFLKMITDLMNQFPEPPTRDPAMAITDLNSPASIISGWSKGDIGRLGLHMPKTSSQRRAASAAGGVMLGVSQDIIQPRQNPIFQRPNGGLRELESPVRICYSKPEDMFSL